ncbi:ABC transporter permease [Rhizobium sp.]
MHACRSRSRRKHRSGQAHERAQQQATEHCRLRRHQCRIYQRVFARIGGRPGLVWAFNPAAALLGPIWLGGRRLWPAFWPFLIAELLTIILIVFALGGGVGQQEAARAARLDTLAAARLAEARAAAQTDPQSVIAKSQARSAAALEKAAAEAHAVARDAQAATLQLAALGGGLFLLVRLLAGTLADHLAERRFRHWRLTARPQEAGFSIASALLAKGLIAFLLPIVWLHFSGAASLATVPSNPDWNSAAAKWLDAAIGGLSTAIAPLAALVTTVIDVMLRLMESMLTATPWPVVMVLLLALSWQLAGFRVLLIAIAAVSYLAILGYWEKSMQTIALLGTAALISVAAGIPLGVLCGYNRKVSAVIRPLLDFMQTMPAFVYLIPVIALFGIGKPSGIIATVIFGIPPVVRLTALGIANVPPTVREAAIAFGATRGFLLFKIDLPTAAPSIMAGISQTILMCLSMVVIAALIGAKGLGEDVLRALQYAAQGQGLLAGLAILLCAIVLDRVVQGRSKPA